MSAARWPAAELPPWLKEGVRYGAASGAALALDLGLFSGLVRLAGVPYLLAAPLAFAFGVALMYALCTRWVFVHRRIAEPRLEFTLFVAIGLVGLCLNELVIWLGVERAGLGYEAAKLVSAAVVFGVNFASRKLVLFTRYGGPA